jgi:hypothetical protein
VDRGALDAALEMGVPCGGWCPKGRRAEDGRIPDRYPLTELEDEQYQCRTLRNVLDSDATLIIYFGVLAGGTELTQRSCITQGKPYCLIDAREIPADRGAELIDKFVVDTDIEVLNVAGPRASQEVHAKEYAFNALAEYMRSRKEQGWNR